MPENSLVQLTVFDVAGKALKTIEGDYNKGYNAIQLNVEDLQSTGVLYYQLNTSFGSLTKKMMVID